jgi:hypothetical protein
VFDAAPQLDLLGAGTYPGYRVFCGLVRPGTSTTPACAETGLFESSPGSGIASQYGNCFASGLAQQAIGDEIVVPGITGTIIPPSGNAFFFTVGHALPNPVRLGQASNGTLRSAAVSCP